MSPNQMSGADIFSVLGDARRRRILELLSESERSVGALAAELGIAQPSVTQHLTALREVGLVDVRKQGTSSIYSLRREAVAEAMEWLRSL